MAPGEIGTKRKERETEGKGSGRAGVEEVRSKPEWFTSGVTLSLLAVFGNFGINGSVVPSNVHKRVADSAIKSCLTG